MSLFDAGPDGSRHERTVVGMDIGGANLKLSDTGGTHLSLPFALWRLHERLGQSIRLMLEEYCRDTGRQISQIALTMTGELADCYATRSQGVRQILQQVASEVDPHRIRVYDVHGHFVSIEEAMQNPWRVAASNWHATASWFTRRSAYCSPSAVESSRLDKDARHVVASSGVLEDWMAAGGGGVNGHLEVDLLVDIGSTTTDLIPIHQGKIATDATTDRERMQRSQLVYTGIQRTPVAMIISQVNLADSSGTQDARGVTACPLMAEVFATTDDVYLCLGLAPENESDTNTADGRPRTRAAAQARLARMVGEDLETLGTIQIGEIAQQVFAAQAESIARAIDVNLERLESDSSQIADQPERPRGVLVAGHGGYLLRAAVERSRFAIECVDLSELIGPDASRNAPCVAVAKLLDDAEKVG